MVSSLRPFPRGLLPHLARPHGRTPVRLAVGRGAFGPALVLAALFALVAAHAGYPVAPAVAVGALGGVASLIVHELGHVRAARRCSEARPVAISVGWLGAATRLEGRYSTGGERLRVAVDGPIASFTLAVSLLAWADAVPGPLELRELAMMLALFNVAVGLLNLIPFAPLDGYNALVGVLWCLLGSEAAARRTLRRVGFLLATVEVPGAVALTVERPALGATVLAVAAACYGQKRLAARAAR
jgi:Zn-dependent protease